VRDLLACERAVGKAGQGHEASRGIAEDMAGAARIGARAAMAANTVSLVPRLMMAVPGRVAPMPTRLLGCRGGMR